MRTFWGDLNARARGLGAHLPSRAWLEEAAGGPLPPPERLLEAAGLAPVPAGAGRPPSGEAEAGPEATERRLRAAAGDRVALLARWSGDERRSARLRVVFEDEDRRSLRSMLRGAAGGVPASRRLAGLLPTPTLPGARLEALAEAADVAEVVRALGGWQHPFAGGLEAAGGGKAAELTPDAVAKRLLDLEVALDRVFHRRAREGARRADPVLRGFIADGIDLENAWTVHALATGGEDVDPASLFLEGGRLLDRERFVEAAGQADSGAAAEILARAFEGSLLAEAASGSEPVVGRREATALRARIRVLGDRAHRAPLGPAPVLHYALRLRAAVQDLRRILWGHALGAPAEQIRPRLVTPA